MADLRWWNPNNAMDAISRGAMIGVLAGAHMVHDEATQRIKNPPKSGRLYRRRGVVHQASAPGQAPATDTWRLIQSGAVLPRPEEVAATINWSALHAKFLELGTRKMAPRPFARVSLMAKEDEIRDAIAQGIGSAL